MKRKQKFSLPGKYILMIITALCVSMIFVSYTMDITVGPFKFLTGYVFIPIQNGINRVGGWFGDRAESLASLKDVMAENEALKAQVDQLTIDNSILQQERYELERLRQLYALGEKYSDYQKIGARVIGKDPGNWFSVFLIDRGSDDGLAVNMNVIAGSGLVGIITEVGPNWATVRSVINDTSNISATDLATSDNCIVSGDLQSMGEHRTIRIQQMIDSDNNVAPGDQVVTSSFSDKFLPGILIGYVTEVSTDTNNLTKSGTLTPVVDFEHIEEVLVILQLK